MTLTDDQARGHADRLLHARDSGVPIAPFTDADPTLGMADGYAIQTHLVSSLLGRGETIVGYKLGLTSRPMQELLGVDSPDFGPVFASGVFRDGAELPVDRFIAPRIEGEIAVVLERDLTGPDCTPLARNGDLGATGAGAAALGDPMAAVAWLANTLAPMGVTLPAGSVIMTGALHAMVPVSPGDVFRADFDRLGPITIRMANK